MAYIKDSHRTSVEMVHQNNPSSPAMILAIPHLVILSPPLHDTSDSLHHHLLKLDYLLRIYSLRCRRPLRRDQSALYSQVHTLGLHSVSDSAVVAAITTNPLRFQVLGGRRRC